MITIAISTFNRPKYLRLALQAILKQTFSDFELFILDNGSGFETEVLIEEFRRKDKRISVLKNLVNSREFVNEIFNLPTREFLLWTHDDDLMKENYLDEMLCCIRNSKLDFLGCTCNYIDSQGGRINLTGTHKVNNQLVILDSDPIVSFFNGEFPSLPTVIMRTVFLRRNELKFNIDIGPAADAYFWYEAIKKGGRIGVLQKKLFSYRLHTLQDSFVNKFSMEIQLFTNWLIENQSNPLYSKLIFNRCFQYYEEIATLPQSFKHQQLLNFINTINPNYLTLKQRILKNLIINESYFLFDLYNFSKRVERFLRRRVIYLFKNITKG